MISIPKLEPGKKIYFVSDLHLGFPDAASSLTREKKFVRWLDFISADAQALIIVGDLFDFWFEYKEAVPRGYVRVLGKLASLHDSGLPIYFFTGNHDQWMFGYFENELNIPVFHSSQQFQIQNKKFFVAHGDGLGPGDHGYKFLKRIFHGKLSHWFFARLHPNAGVALGKKWSRNNRFLSGNVEETFKGAQNEWLVQFAKSVLQKEHFDYFIFGHRHLAIDFALGENSKYFNLGDWISFYTYAEFDGIDLYLKKFEG
jgi:UDP-2,3-diacylglucosamine hydrolase